MRFRTLLLGHHDEGTAPRIAQCLDRMEPSSRMYTVRTISAHELETLWTLCEGSTLDSSHFVPSGVGVLSPVRHYGKNSLPAFSLFEKRFCRAEGSDEVYGYNHQTFQAFTGPGYFVGRASDTADDPAAYVLDYEAAPKRVPDEWPKLMDNAARLGRFVYYRTRDYIRKVSEHVCVGRLYKRGHPENVYFILCREAEPS